MTKIGLISDTHLKQLPQPLLGRLAAAWAGVSQIWHCGDVVGPGVINDLLGLGLGPVVAVAGNMDGLPLSHELPRKREITVEGRRIGIMHGWGPPDGLAARVAAEFPGAEAVIFGHSHTPTNLVRNGVLMVNPGSAAQGRGSGTSVGVLTVNGGIQAEIIKLT